MTEEMSHIQGSQLTHFMPYSFYSVKAVITLGDVLYGPGYSMCGRKIQKMVQKYCLVDLDDILRISMRL